MMPRLSRRAFLGAAGAGGLGLGALALEGFVLGPHRLRVSHEVVGAPDGGTAGLRLAVLADLHLDQVDPFLEGVAEAVTTARPDTVLLVGDSIDRADRLPVLRDFLALLPHGVPRYATLGNWEYWSGVDLGALGATYESGGVRLLVNEAAVLAPGAVVYGLDDSLTGRPSIDGLNAVPDGQVLLLSHCPEYRDRLDPGIADRIAAVLSGHTHGGQVALGRWAPVLPPGSAGYVSGWYRDGGPDLFVTRGIGTSLVPVRLGSPPEVVVVDWYPGAV